MCTQDPCSVCNSLEACRFPLSSSSLRLRSPHPQGSAAARRVPKVPFLVSSRPSRSSSYSQVPCSVCSTFKALQDLTKLPRSSSPLPTSSRICSSAPSSSSSPVRPRLHPSPATARQVGQVPLPVLDPLGTSVLLLDNIQDPNHALLHQSAPC